MGSGVSRGKKSQNEEAQTASPSQQTVPIRVQPLQQQSPQHPTRSPRRSSRQSQGESRQSPRSHHSSPRNHDENGSEHSEINEQEDEEMRMHFAQSAMSLGMDNDDLIFNLLYFGDNSSSFQTMFNSAIEETVAAHSAGNTPYKLRPASVEALDLLKVVIMTSDTKVDQNECSICQEDLEVGQEIVFLPVCSHSFHNECLQRWFRLVTRIPYLVSAAPHPLSSQQSWCPICRTEILTQSNPNGGLGSVSNRKMSNGWKANLNTAFEEYEDEGDEGEDYENEAMMEASYLIETGRGLDADCREHGGEEEDGEEEKEEEDEQSSSSYPLRVVPSMESLLAKKTIDSVMGDVVSHLR